MGWFGVRTVAVSAVVAVSVGLLPAVAAAGTGSALSLPGVQQPKAVPVKLAKTGGGKRIGQVARSWKAPKVNWPAAGGTDIALPGAEPAADSATAPSVPSLHRAGSLPVRAGAVSGASGPAKLHVSVADRTATQKTGVDGLLLSVGRADGVNRPGPAKVEIDYGSFKGAYGGDWASRLHLVQLPACALTTPDKAACRTASPVRTTNDTAASTLSAQIMVAPQSSGATVLAAEADASGPSGTYKATSLQASGSWSAGDSTGAFNWTYPMSAPEVPGGLEPSVSLGYSSLAVDGRTSASNNQPSSIGDGWSYEPGFIERSYKSCNDDQTGGTNTAKVGDQCWYTDNATLSLGGRSTELVYDSTHGWHAADDSGQKIEKLTNADEVTGNGDNDGEHWKVTATDGTQYFFGLNRLPGWTGSTTPETNSTWTVPVFGNQSGEPCYNASFAAAWCQQAWRWQLDYVVDVHGNAMAYYWDKETNDYGRNYNETTGLSTPTPYTRGGYLDHIDYGLRSDAVYSGRAMGKVAFTTKERCLEDCGTFDTTHATNWPDVPFDQYCKDGGTCTPLQTSPSFWSRKRLTSVTTQVLTGGAYKNVDTWQLNQDFPPSGDGISTPMWLNSITRGTTDTSGNFTALLPPTTFSPEQMANRVDKTGDGIAPFVRLRVSQITTESGGTVGVYYNDPGCTATSLPPADGTNQTTCYPVKWASEGDTATLDWFNTYPVKQVVEGDNLAATPDKVTSYTYLGGAAWAKSTDEFTKPADRTYSVQRGYGLVQTRSGAGFDTKSLSETRYFRGIDGASVADSAGTSVTDREQFAGMVRESATYDGDDTAKLVSATSYTPWRSAATATRARTGLPDLVAYHTGTSDEQTRTTVTGGTRTTAVHSTFDSYGMVATSSSTGDTDKSGDESCTSTTYARNTTLWLLDRVAELKSVDRSCDVTPTLPADLNADTRTYYDGATSLTAAPTKGNVTKVEQINGTGSAYDQVTATPVASFDIYGRALSVADAYGKTTTTAYTPATGEVPTQTVVTNPLSQDITTTYDPRRGQPLTVTDANNRVTTLTYDSLGRTTQVWTPSRAQATYPTAPSYKFGYTVRNDGPTVVTTSALNYNDLYQTSYAFYDGLLRPYETQSPSPDDSGRLVTETFYDTRGLAWRNSGTYYADGAAEPVPVTGQELNYPASTDTVYDGAGRATQLLNRKFGDPAESTTTTYTGDTTTVVPPLGGTATTTVVDALGRTTELKQYTDAARTQAQSTLSTYDAHGRLFQVQDPSGAKWTYTYDTRGRQITADDPDKGASTTAYDAGDRVTDVTDARGYKLHTAYDDLARKTKLTSTYQGVTTTLSEWTYDTATGGKGLPAKATQYVGGQPYTSEVTSYSSLSMPAISQVTVPGTGGLAGTYKWTTAYYPTGQVKWTRQPAMGGLPQEDITPLYTANSALPVTLAAGSDPIVSNTVYDHYGRDVREEYGAFNHKVYSSQQYDEHTGALTDQTVDRDTAPQRIDTTHYAYDQAGNVTSITDTTGQDAAAVTDNQCFTIDALRRITQAWTTNTDSACAQGASADTVGGPDAYWTSYGYDAVGNRTTETQHTTAAGPATDTVRTYAPPATGTHNLPKVTQTGSAPGTDDYTYDADGNTATRTLGSNPQQTLNWDAQGHLASVSQGADIVAAYTYDTDGNRLTSTNPSGTTLYLPGGNELLLKPDNSLVGTRYYSYNGKTVALRTAGAINYLITDPHGTATTQIDATTQAVARRKTTIFGSDRGTAPTTWQGTKGFVGGTADAATGLTHLGAREYDPTTARFISVDPLLDLNDPQQMNGYAYGDNNPLAFSDSDGLRPIAGNGGYSEDEYNKDHNAFWTNTSSGGWTYNETHTQQDDRDTYVAVVSVPTHGQTTITVAHFHAKPKPPPSVARQTWNFIKSAAQTTAKIFNPAAILSAGEMAIGLIATGIGASADVAGGALCVTGVGCLAGAPAVWAASTLAGIGITLLGKGANDLINSEKTALSESSGDGGSGSDSSSPSDWTLPDSATSKVPGEMGTPKPTKKGVGWRWNDGKGNGIRIDQGNPNNSQEYQQVDHVVINRGGRIIGRNGEPIVGSIQDNAYEAHIPLSEWVKWKNWYTPK
ncbi:RHS repeat domain-containing protein [Actinacidiphila bryophytorum]|uniref:HintN domain-containing protein n=1 Tax=Actinacidiphila bryophytorum TaxID=1436133 RepID=A0A9W4E163_9ACTN|nr:RHS repeat-associated core domain-containing protein [Actinacidiphila bryophytorum]MBM9439718.1 RHS repeat-associated core domain-containing protein [Actinacidiphila bryophytorum]MBN6542084.1 RHS repeat-associated core domain-containing protein [Actinacidiphila bryophytorum]CAG7605904.1 HintN domain-containing protein [Actinacidiphila bryophytorum]